MSDERIAIMFLVGITITILVGVAAYFTHIIATIAAQAWIFMVAGVLFPPIAIAHGFSVWFGLNVLQ